LTFWSIDYSQSNDCPENQPINKVFGQSKGTWPSFDEVVEVYKSLFPLFDQESKFMPLQSIQRFFDGSGRKDR
jgi:hypothetical protein